MFFKNLITKKKGVMKKLVFLFFIAVVFSSCQKYEFQEDDSQILKTEIGLKNSQGNFASVDTARITVNIQVILKAVTISGSPEQWYWDFGDGNEGQGQQIDHLYTETGTYNVTVTAIDGNNSDESEIVLIVESNQKAVFSLHSSYSPNDQGEIRYIVSGSKEYIPDPPVPTEGPFGYQGSNPESDWDVVQIASDTSDTRIYWEIITHNTVYSQAYGGFDDNNSFVWADMDESRFFSNDYDHLRVGFLDGQIVEEENFETKLLGSSGDSGNNPEVRYEVNEDEDQVDIYVNVIDYSETINSPKARYKVTEEDSWSSQEDTEWVGGTGYVVYSAPINNAGEYRIRIESDQYDPGTYTQMTGSKFYVEQEEGFVAQINVVDGQQKATAP